MSCPGQTSSTASLQNLHFRPSEGGESVFTFEEIYFTVSSPDQSSVHIVRNPLEAVTEALGVAGVHVAGGGEPPVLGPLEEVDPPIGPGEGGVQRDGQTVPALGHGPEY